MSEEVERQHRICSLVLGGRATTLLAAATLALALRTLEITCIDEPAPAFSDHEEAAISATLPRRSSTSWHLKEAGRVARMARHIGGVIGYCWRKKKQFLDWTSEFMMYRHQEMANLLQAGDSSFGCTESTRAGSQIDIPREGEYLVRA